jgi:rhomboid protease GluP
VPGLRVLTAITLLVVGAFAYRVMTVEERTRALRAVDGTVCTTLAVVGRGFKYRRDELEPFTRELRARTTFALATPLLVALSVVIFAAALVAGVPHEPAALLSWGASVGARTTNGEWWRLVTALFVHAGVIALVLNAAALFEVGLIVERLAGSFALATTYIGGGVAAGLVGLRLHPTTVAAGDTGGVLAVYGLFSVLLAVGWIRRAPLRIPLVALKWLAPVTALFVLYNFAGGWSSAHTTALASGVALGIGVARDYGTRRPPLRRTAVALAVGAAIAVAIGVSMRGMLDVRPEIDRLADLESSTATRYDAAVVQLRRGRTTAAALADLIDQTIMPQLHAAEARVSALDGVPPAEAWRVTGAREYLRLRSESWTLRSQALRAGSSEDDEPREAPGHTLRTAESAERQSLQVLEEIREPRPPQN